jgi:hypothetical protein
MFTQGVECSEGFCHADLFENVRALFGIVSEC